MGREESETPNLDSFPNVFCCKGKQRDEEWWVEGMWGQDGRNYSRSLYSDGNDPVRRKHSVIGDRGEACLRDV